jgi:regulatory protein
MIVTNVESLTKTKFIVEVDGKFAFVLYKGELKRFGVTQGVELSEKIYQQIRTEIVLKRAKLRAMHLLTDMARSEKGLREKLRQGHYPEDIIEQAMDYVRSFGYLDDRKYAESFVLSRKESKSRKEIYAALLQKGVSAEQIQEVLDEVYAEEGEREAIRKLILKKHVDVLQANEEELHKLYGYLARKGFRYEEIRKAIEEMNADNDGLNYY